MKKSNRLTVYTLFLFVTIALPFKFTWAQVNQDNLRKHIYHLADDKMKGRGTGSKEVKQAANYIEKHFKKYKLTPKGTKRFRQTFEARVRRVQVIDSIRTAENVIGYLDNGAPYTIVIGAHYDHLGEGMQGGSKDSLGVGAIHNGADDNASGVAALLELARHYSTNNIRENHNILFIAFGAEELGLVGSKHFTNNPTIPLNSILCMLNMDMIGRYNAEQGVAVIGYGTSKKWPDIFDKIQSPVKYYTGHDGNGGSDQTSFYKKDIPVLFFHTGGHPDYHMPTDDPDKIDYASLQGIIELEIMVIDNIMQQKDKMDFQFTN